MEPSVRQAWLTTKARLRSAGLLPWCLLIAVAVYAFAVDPPVLRSGGAQLREAATFVVAGIVWCLLVLVPPARIPSRPGVRLGSNLALTFLVVVATGVLAVCLGFWASAGAAPGWLRTLHLLLLLSGLAAAVSASTQTIVNKLFMLALGAQVAAVWPRLWLAPSSETALTATTGLSLGASVLFAMALRRPTTVVDRDARRTA